jgi:hypothetical protein
VKIMWSFITEKSTINYKAETISYNYSLCVQWNLSWETYFIIGNHTHLCETTILCTRSLSLVRDHYFVYETIFCGVRPPSLVWAHIFLCETTILVWDNYSCMRQLFLCETTILVWDNYCVYETFCSYKRPPFLVIDHYFVYETLFSCLRPSVLMWDHHLLCHMLSYETATRYFNNKKSNLFPRDHLPLKDHNFLTKWLGLSRRVSLYFCYEYIRQLDMSENFKKPLPIAKSTFIYCSILIRFQIKMHHQNGWKPIL